MPITLTDSEQRFADSPAGRLAVSRARARFDKSNAYLRDHAPRWTDAMEADAVRSLATSHARNRVNDSAAQATMPGELEAARAGHVAASFMRKQAIRDGWKG